MRTNMNANCTKIAIKKSSLAEKTISDGSSGCAIFGFGPIGRLVDVAQRMSKPFYWHTSDALGLQ